MDAVAARSFPASFSSLLETPTASASSHSAGTTNSQYCAHLSATSEAAAIITSVKGDDCLCMASGFRHSSRTPSRLSHSVATSSGLSSAWFALMLGCTVHRKHSVFSRNRTACIFAPSLAFSESANAFRSSLRFFEAFQMSFTAFGTVFFAPAPLPLFDTYTNACLKSAVAPFAAAFATAAESSPSKCPVASTHGAIRAGCAEAICSHRPAIVLRTAALVSTRISSSGSRNSSNKPASLCTTSSARVLRCAHFCVASPASFASFSVDTAWSRAQLSSVAGSEPAPLAPDPDAPFARDLGGIASPKGQRHPSPNRDAGFDSPRSNNDDDRLAQGKSRVLSGLIDAPAAAERGAAMPHFRKI